MDETPSSPWALPGIPSVPWPGAGKPGRPGAPGPPGVAGAPGAPGAPGQRGAAAAAATRRATTEKILEYCILIFGGFGGRRRIKLKDCLVGIRNYKKSECE